MTQEAFKTWWHNEGSQAPYTHHDCEEHTMRMCEIAWNKAAQTLAQPKQEPVAFASHGVINWIADKQFQHEADLYTTPPQRKPLTKEQRKDLMDKAWNKWLGGEDDNHLFAWHFSFEVEAAHGIKEDA